MLSLLCAKAETREQARFFANAAQGIISEEMQMHLQLLDSWGLARSHTDCTPQLPSSLLYTSYLKATIYEAPFYEGADCASELVMCAILA